MELFTSGERENVSEVNEFAPDAHETISDAYEKVFPKPENAPDVHETDIPAHENASNAY